jgi:membrane-associated phospholipid phosphatase
VSYHSASAAALVLVSRPLENASLTLAFLLLACLVGWARVYQGRHTVSQVLVGALTTLPIGMLG